jgi:hypothetical protein
MIPQWEGQFTRHLTATGAFVTACPHCHRSIGYAFWEADLDALEKEHVCTLAALRGLEKLPGKRSVSRGALGDLAHWRRCA